MLKYAGVLTISPEVPAFTSVRLCVLEGRSQTATTWWPGQGRTVRGSIEGSGCTAINGRYQRTAAAALMTFFGEADRELCIDGDGVGARVIGARRGWRFGGPVLAGGVRMSYDQ